MKIGCCAGIEKAPVLYQAGYDFIECTVVSLLPEASEEEFTPILRKYQESPIPVQSFNILLPGDLKIVGEQVDKERIKRYLSTALKRVKQIGADTIVFGSGGARTLPNGFSRKKGEEQIVEFLHMTADIADPLGLTIVIEPLNKKESNIINSVPEAVAFAKLVNRKSIKTLADFYHMDEEKEPLTHIYENKDFVKHIHVADTGRISPGMGSYPYPEFLNQIRRSQYNGRMAIECNWNDFETEAKQALIFLKKQLNFHSSPLL
ncbi:sugar phosphate isomerase/epimerase family protein [Neobacillus drentensis]|uniref:sugar phosphate isomerase/epimerase family protein n=1 Tax=Neobacillus drentensis TaxID=220684 RepID=UPI002FFF851D